MKKVILLTSALLIFAATALADVPSFSGTWVTDETKPQTADPVTIKRPIVINVDKKTLTYKTMAVYPCSLDGSKTKGTWTTSRGETYETSCEFKKVSDTKIELTVEINLAGRDPAELQVTKITLEIADGGKSLSMTQLIKKSGFERETKRNLKRQEEVRS